MSQSDDQGGAGRREVAWRLFAAEYEDADFSYSESDEERAPNYVVTPSGARVNRLFVVGVLTETESVNDDVLRARVVDPTGAFVVYAGQYQPDALAFLERADPPTFVALTGKARTFQPEDSDTVYTSVRPESINEVDAETRDRWTVGAAEQTLHRVATMAKALAREERGDDLRAVLTAAGIDEGLASGVAMAAEHYGTTPTYLDALRRTALDAARVVAGEVDEVEAFATAPDAGGSVTLSDLADLESPLGEFDVAGVPATAAAGSDAGVDADAAVGAADSADAGAAEAGTDVGDGAGDDTVTDEAATESVETPQQTDSPDETTSPDSPGTAALGEGQSGSDDADADESPEPMGADEAADDPVSATDSTPDDGAESETVTAEAEPETPDPEAGGTDLDTEADAEPEPDAETDSASTDAPGAASEHDATAESGPGAGDEATDDEDIGDFEPGEFELDDEEREEIEDEYGTEFSTGSEVDEPGEADIETPTPDSEPEPDQEAEPVDESAADSADTAESEEADESAAGAEDEGDEAPESAEADADVDLRTR